MSDRIEGKIAAILDDTTVVINRGSEDGVKKGDMFFVFSDTGPVYDPDTGESLGSTERIWGKLKVGTVQPRLCVAATQFSMSFSAFDWLGTRDRLPIDKEDLENPPDRIHVGSRVVSVAQRSSRAADETTSPPSDEHGNTDINNADDAQGHN